MGASDDDPAAIGTCAVAGAALGPSLLWVAPIALPMMLAVVYLSPKLGQVAGQGLFAAIRQHYPRQPLYFLLLTAIVGTILEAGADPVPISSMAVVLGIFVRLLALVLLAYIGSTIPAKPDFTSVSQGKMAPILHFHKTSFAMLVAVIGKSLSAYLYSCKTSPWATGGSRIGSAPHWETYGMLDGWFWA